MQLDKLAEPFPPESIRWRIVSAGMQKDGKTPWARLVCYVDARDVMNRLDDVCGVAGWACSYEQIDGGFLCHLAICCDGDWITKTDGAQRTEIEAIKGGLSDALKRAAVPWGIGRYLYTLTESWAECSNNEKALEYKNAKAKDRITKKEFLFSWTPGRQSLDALKAAGEEVKGNTDAASSKSAPAKKKKTKKTEKEEKDAKSEAYRVARPDITFATASQLKQIGMLRTDIGVSDEAYRSILFTDFGVETAKDLPTAGKRSAVELIDRLKQRRAFQLEQEGKEAFGDPDAVARLENLRKAALGFCSTIKRWEEAAKDGNPIDYKEEGLVVTTLEELVQLITAMEDDKELEGVITHLDALAQKLSF